MATLSADQLRRLVELPEDIIPFPPEQQRQMQAAACWNWVLNAGTGQLEGPTSPVKLYEGTCPIVYVETGTGEQERAGPEIPGLPALLLEQLTVVWRAAKQEQDDADQAVRGRAPRVSVRARKAFMRTMARITARLNGLSLANPIDAQTPYSVAVTVPATEWYHWQHWALGFTHGNRTAWVQTEPGNHVFYGGAYVWESNRVGHLTVAIHIQAIHQGHKNALELALGA